MPFIFCGKNMDNFSIILPPKERFQTTNSNSFNGFCLLDNKHRNKGLTTIDEAKKLLTLRREKYHGIAQFMPDHRVTFGFKAFKTRYGWRSKETLPNGKEIRQQLHFPGYKKCCKKIDKIQYPSGNLYTLVLAQSEAGDYIRIRQKNTDIIGGYTVLAQNRNFSKKGLLKHIEQFALKVGQNPDGSERPVLRKVGGFIFDIARKFKR